MFCSEENHYLSTPPELAAKLEPEIAELVGYGRLRPLVSRSGVIDEHVSIQE
jgi:hypothetical protein